MTCPECRETIPEDSRFCDRCGSQLPVCPLCGEAGDGKRCIHDGTILVSPGSRGEHGQKPPHGTPEIAPAPGQRSFFADEVLLSGKNTSLILELRDGDILGRAEGRFSAQLLPFSQISGRHAGVRKGPGGHWTVTDYGSTNGTFLNGNRIAVMRPEPIRDGMLISIADLEFILSVPGERPVSPTATVRIRLDRNDRR